MAEASPSEERSTPAEEKTFTFGTMNCNGPSGMGFTDKRFTFFESVINDLDAWALQEMKPQFKTFAQSDSDYKCFYEETPNIESPPGLLLKKGMFDLAVHIRSREPEIPGIKGRFVCALVRPNDWDAYILLVSYHGPHKDKDKQNHLRSLILTVKKMADGTGKKVVVGEEENYDNRKAEFILIGGDFNYKEHLANKFLSTDEEITQISRDSPNTHTLTDLHEYVHTGDDPFLEFFCGSLTQRDLDAGAPPSHLPRTSREETACPRKNSVERVREIVDIIDYFIHDECLPVKNVRIKPMTHEKRREHKVCFDHDIIVADIVHPSADVNAEQKQVEETYEQLTGEVWLLRECIGHYEDKRKLEHKQTWQHDNYDHQKLMKHYNELARRYQEMVKSTLTRYHEKWRYELSRRYYKILNEICEKHTLRPDKKLFEQYRNLYQQRDKLYDKLERLMDEIKKMRDMLTKIGYDIQKRKEEENGDDI